MYETLKDINADIVLGNVRVKIKELDNANQQDIIDIVRAESRSQIKDVCDAEETIMEILWHEYNIEE